MNLRSGALLIVILAQSMSPQDAPPAEDGRASAIRRLASEYETAPKQFDANDDGYRIAYMAEADRRPGLAMQWLTREAQRSSAVNDHALARMSRIARSSGNLLLERVLLERVRHARPNGQLSLAAVDRLAAGSLESGDAAGAIAILTASNTSTRDATPRQAAGLRERQAILGNAYAAGRRDHEARRLFAQLLDGDRTPQFPDDHSYAAVIGLDRLDGISLNANILELGEAEHMRRAAVYQFYRDFGPARLHLRAVIENHPTAAPNALFQMGRTYAQSGEYGETVKWYERLLERHPDSPAAKDGLLQLASAYSRVGKSKEALARYQNYIDKFPADERLDRAYLNQVDVLRDSGDIGGALRWCERTESAFRGKPAEAAAVFARGRIHLARQEWVEALASFDRLVTLSDLGGNSIPGGTTEAEVAFLRGVTLEKLGRYTDAIEVYLSIPDGRDEYYGWQATKRLRTLAASGTAASALAEKIGTVTAGLKAKDAETRRLNAQALLRMTSSPEARETAITTLKAAVKALPRYPSPPTVKPRPVSSTTSMLVRMEAYDDAVIEMVSSAGDASHAELFIKGDRGDKAIALVEPLWKKLPPDFPIDLMPRDQLRLLYPVVYRDELITTAAKDDIDPRLILAIMRQESRFRPGARSGAGARGLMQFISTTATDVARQLDIPAFEQDDLYDATTAVMFGSRHAADLFKAFPGKSEAVVAAYNAGDDNVKRWLERAHSDQAEFYVPEIMFTQTKDYVHRVMANLRMYQLLYDEALNPVD